MKFFVISDVHGYFNEMIAALDAAGFDKDNENHWLISLGDNIDRGRQPWQVMKYLMSLPQAILVKGNHESLALEMCARGYAESYDYSNGTMQTIVDLAPHARDMDEACSYAEKKLLKFTSNMVNYVELKNYVLTHGFIPVQCDDSLPAYYERNRRFSRMENWREATKKQWEDARWLNGMKMVHNGFGIEKTIIVGHYHASWGRYTFEGKPEFGEGSDFSPYYYEDKLIAIDGCTAYTGKVNCLVIEDEFTEGNNGMQM